METAIFWTLIVTSTIAAALLFWAAGVALYIWIFLRKKD